MQTRFTDEQLANPRVAAAEGELRRCVHCGFCNARCPTYQLTGDELDSPRGRIYLIKEMLEGGNAPAERAVFHLDRCLSCLSCKTTCPSGVNYETLIDNARATIEERHERPLLTRLARAAVLRLFPQRRLFGLAMALARPAPLLAPLLPKALAQRARMAAFRHRSPLTVPPAPAPTGDAPVVLMLPGCVQPTLGDSINQATRSTAHRLGYRVEALRGTDCCGAIEQHLGQPDAARERVAKNAIAWVAQLDRTGADAIVVNASGCGSQLKHYGELLAGHPAAEAGQRVAAATLDSSEWLERTLAGRDDRPLPAADALPTLAYHGACSLQHGQRRHGAVVGWLRGLGFVVHEPRDAHLCCGSAGTYNLFQPAMAGELGARKAATLKDTGARYVVAGNMGCALQIAAHDGPPVVHLAELMDWALAQHEVS